ncbi:hypothetical protein ACSNOH_04800 [Streptomyces sp. URMC 127]|uniref:hypothetical protein n=1 Tax=Streptomyces sp. URMC 127 TaxID=3423402 RepID=UPI003F196268
MGDQAVDEERWDQPGDWRIREYLLHRLRVPESHESTDRLLLRHRDEQIGACERQLTEQPEAPSPTKKTRPDAAVRDRPAAHRTAPHRSVGAEG